MNSNWLTKILSLSERKQIESQITSLEIKTTAEVIICFIKSSTPLYYIQMLLSLLISLFALAALFIWNPVLNPWIHGLVILVALLSGAVVSKLLLKFPIFVRPFLNRAQSNRLSFQRAQVEFLNSNIKSTAESTGLLIFFSYFEKKVHILADQGVHQYFSNEYWQTHANNLVQNLTKKELSKGLSSVLTQLEKDLNLVLPAKENNPNELSDMIMVYEE